MPREAAWSTASVSDSTSGIALQGHRKRAAIAENDIERIADRVLLCEVSCAVLQARGNWSSDAGMTETRRDQRFELPDERRCLLRRDIETKHFYRDEPIASRLGRAKHRAERTRTNLMENPEWPECLGRKVQQRIFAVQRPNGNIISLHIPVDIRRFPGIRKVRGGLRV